MVSCMLTLLCTALALCFAVCSQAPGLRQLALEPYSATSASTASMSYRAAIWLDFPGLFATVMFVAVRQMAAMAKSGLFPAFLHNTTSYSNTPYTARVGTSLLSLSCVVAAVYLYQPWQRELFSTGIIGSYLVYISVFVSYLVLQTKYSSLSRGFVNPLGSASAVLGIAIFLLGDISLLGFYVDNQLLISFLAHSTASCMTPSYRSSPRRSRRRSSTPASSTLMTSLHC